MIARAFILILAALVTPLVRGQCPNLPNPLPQPSQLPTIQTLPNPFRFFNGTGLRSSADWGCRRRELLTIVQHYMYGNFPDRTQETVAATRSGNTLTIRVTASGRSGQFTATLNLPSGASAQNKVPVVITTGFVDTAAFINNRIALATFSTGSVAADSNSKTGAFWDIYNGRDIGVITAWGWGFHRVLDAIIQSVPEIDSSRVGATGCSRDGKAALAAGIFDERITLTLPMSSGLEGTGPWRYHFEQSGANEKINNIVGAYPYWMNSNLAVFVNNVQQLPFDAHIQAALIAPRAQVWDQGQSDYWVNPQGTASVTFVAAQAVYRFLGVENKIGVAIRTGGHCELGGYNNILPFVLREFFGTQTSRNYANISPYSPYTQAFPWANCYSS